jgi:hypothetical protein
MRETVGKGAPRFGQSLRDEPLKRGGGTDGLDKPRLVILAIVLLWCMAVWAAVILVVLSLNGAL